jgi:hypothetical protein
MSIREVYDNPGSFEVTLRADTPPELLKSIGELDHLVIHSQGIGDGRLTRFTDATLKSEARYAGPIMNVEFNDLPFVIRGHGMQWHLGDSIGHGPIMAEVLAFTDATLATVLDDAVDDGIIPASLTQGTITNPAGTYTGTFYPGDISLDAFRTVMKSLACHYRINPDGTVDAGPDDSNEVYLVDESDGGRLAVAIPYGWGSDPQRVSLESIRTRSARDATNWVSRVVVVDEQYDGSNTITNILDRDPNPYYDIRNNPLIRNRRVTRPASDAVTSVEDFLTSELAAADVDKTVDLDMSQWEIADGTIEVGDFLHVYNPQAGIEDVTNEIQHRGMRIFPKRIRILEGDWPLTKGMGVYVRPGGSAVTAADWLDLTPYVEWERIP